VLPDRVVKGAILLDAVVVRPLLATRLLMGWRERRYAFLVLCILHHEPVRRLRERDDVIALSEKIHPFAIEDLQHLAIGRHVVGFQEGCARDRYEIRIEDSLSDAIGAPMPFVAVIRPQHSFENRLELSLGVFALDRFVSTRGHVFLIPMVSGGEAGPSVRLTGCGREHGPVATRKLINLAQPQVFSQAATSDRRLPSLTECARFCELR
jgi:hypothetical protein